MFKINNKDTRATPGVSIVNFEHISYFKPSGVFIVNFEQENAGWVAKEIQCSFTNEAVDINQQK